jgi:serine/threonine protein kinase
MCDLINRSTGGVMSADQDAQPLPQIDGFDVLNELGRGGMGVVYRAKELRSSRDVALKMIKGTGQNQAIGLARFRIEAGALACLAHPNILTFHRLGLHEGSPYLVLEYASRGNLATFLAGQPRPPRWAAEALRPIAHALAAAHAKGILHRDLKPSNVLITEDGTLKVSDLGLVKLTRPEEETFTSETIRSLASVFQPLSQPRIEPIDQAELNRSIDQIWHEHRMSAPLREDDAEPDAIKTFVDQWLSQLEHRTPRDAARCNA